MAAKLWRGSTGAEVETLQTQLNQNGYELDVDGVFGHKTYNAVLDYQQRNHLAVDGVVGDETWGSLRRTTAPAEPTNGKSVLSGVSDETYDKLYALERGYSPSDEVVAAQSVQSSLEAIKPGAYRSTFDSEIERLYEEIMGRKAYAYDPAQDTAYRNYAYLYAQRGKSAMEDTMGQAAGLTGGYASSYAQTAGQQAYGRYLSELAELMPQLEENARERYDRQGAQLMEQYELTGQREKDAYKRWQEEQQAWEDEYKRASDTAKGLREQDYNDYKLLLQHYTTKANAEQKASDGSRANSGKEPAAASRTAALSSTAAESLERAMGNYLKGGRTQEADALAQQYKNRMTAAQKQTFRKLFAQYGMVTNL